MYLNFFIVQVLADIEFPLEYYHNISSMGLDTW